MNTKEIVKLLDESIQIKIDLKKIKDGLIDKVVEPALQKLVDDTANPLDNVLKAAIAPSLEKALKDMLDKEIDKLEAAIKAKLDAIKA